MRDRSILLYLKTLDISLSGVVDRASVKSILIDSIENITSEDEMLKWIESNLSDFSSFEIEEANI